MNQLLLTAASAALCVLVGACSFGSKQEQPQAIEAEWSAVNLPVDSVGQYYVQTLALSGNLKDVKALGFNQFARIMEPVDSRDTLVELVPGYYELRSPRFAAAAQGDTVKVALKVKGAIRSICYGIDGVHAIYADGSVGKANMRYADMLASRDNYATADLDRMPDAEEIFLFNRKIGNTPKTNPYSVVPSFKNVAFTGDTVTVDFGRIDFKADESMGEKFKMTVDTFGVSVVAAPRQFARLKARLQHNFGTGKVSLPAAVVEDWPDLEYRGLMIDVARNYQKPEEMKRVLDLMAVYGFNHLHFHLTDDEAWRLEISGLPELTQVGSRRGYGKGMDKDFLPQIFAGDGNPESAEGTANGFLSRQDFKDIIRYADSLGIAVIPEIESPGHGRAAIMAMNKRAENLADSSWIICDPRDSSVYTSAQSFHDNIMNPAMEGTYKLMDIVISDIMAMYEEAGVQLPAIHIGGDEVPRNAWSGSPAVHELMKREGLADERAVHAYFVSRVADIMARKGVKLSGWQEIALRHSPDYNKTVAPQTYSVNCWSTLPSQGQGGVIADIANTGFPMVLSNVNHFYLDMTYNYHPMERGLSWGGTVDEFDALNGYASRLCPYPQANLKGIQAQVFAETIRSPQGLEIMLLPKMLGVAERAWNTDSTYTHGEFHSVVLADMPKWEQADYAYHLRQPGVKIADGKIHFNSPYPGAKLYYTLDGTMPGKHSPCADGNTVDAPQRPFTVKAILVEGPYTSACTVAYAD